jgi:Ni/Co efflux regulator RcnB
MNSMRKLLVLAALAALVGVQSPAMAQDRGRHEGQDNGGRVGGNENRGGGPQSGISQSAPNPAAENGRGAIGQRETREHHDAPAQARSAPAMAQAPERRNDNRSDFNQQNRGNRDNDARRGEPGRQDFNRPGPAGPNNSFRGQRRDFSNFRNYHQNFRAERRFRVAPYRRPPGFYSHRWGWGEFLPAPFWVRDYWLIDYFDYGLPPPPFGAIWVRVGDDALLIDRDSGEIIEVDYGVFY